MIEVLVDDNLTIISAKQELFLMFGSATTQTLATFLFDEDLLKIKSLLKTKENQMLSKFKSTYCVKDVLIKKSPEITYIEGRQVYKLYIIVISDIFNDYLNSEMKITNLSMACALSNVIVFEYSKIDNHIRLSNGSDEVLFEGDLEDIKSKSNEKYYLDLYNALVQEQESMNIKTDEYKIVSNSYILDYKKNIVGVITNNNLNSDDANKYESITGLYTKRAFLNYFKNNIGERCTLIRIEIDYYNSITYETKDKYIDSMKLVADCIKEQIKGYGIAGILDKDQFAVYLNTEDEIIVRSICEALRVSVQSKTQNDEFPITISMGLARKPIDADNADTLNELAEKALFIAKSRGRNRYIIYREKMHKHISIIEKKTDIGKVFVGVYKQMTANLSGESRVKNALSIVKELMNFDQINVYIDNNIKYCFGEKLDYEGIINEKNLKLFDKKGVLVIDNTMPIMSINPIAYELFENQDVLSVIQVLIKKEDDILGYISFENKKERRSYSINEAIVVAAVVEIIKEYII